MEQRDPSDARRSEVVSVALELIALTGYTSSTLGQLAAAAGLEQSELVDLFGSREALFAEVIRRRDELDSEQFVGDLGPTIGAFGDTIESLVRQNSRVPGLVQLFSGVTAEATPADHSSHGLVARRYQDANSVLAEALDGIAASGFADRNLPAPMLGVLTSALIDGLQTQWLYDRNLDMGAHIRLFWQLVDQVYAADPTASSPETQGSGSSAS